MAYLNEIKNKNLRIIALVLTIGAAVLILASFFVKQEKEANLLRLFGYVFLVSTGLMRFFSGSFLNKPTRIDYEKKNFDN
jgi:uncharacterized membrane protein YwaF